MRRIRWAWLLVGVLVVASGCRHATIRFNAYDTLLVPPLMVAPQSGATPDVAERVAYYTVSQALRKMIFPEVVQTAEEIRGQGRVLRVDATITRYQAANVHLQRWVGFGSGRGGVLLDVRFVDDATNTIVDQVTLKGASGGWLVEGTEPAISRAAGAIVRYLWYNKSNKPYHLRRY